MNQMCYQRQPCARRTLATGSEDIRLFVFFFFLKCFFETFDPKVQNFLKLQDCNVKVWKVLDRSVELTLAHSSPVTAIAFSHYGKVTLKTVRTPAARSKIF